VIFRDSDSRGDSDSPIMREEITLQKNTRKITLNKYMNRAVHKETVLFHKETGLFHIETVFVSHRDGFCFTKKRSLFHKATGFV